MFLVTCFCLLTLSERKRGSGKSWGGGGGGRGGGMKQRQREKESEKEDLVRYCVLKKSIIYLAKTHGHLIKKNSINVYA